MICKGLFRTCRINLCVFFLPPLLLLFIWGYLVEPALYEHRISSSAGVDTEFISGALSAANYAKWNPLIAHMTLNASHDICANQYDAVCERGTPSYSDLVGAHSKKALERILNGKRVGNTHFFRACQQFHTPSATLVNKLEFLEKHPRFKELFASILSIQSVDDLVRVTATKLHSSGVREPFHLNLLIDGDYEFSVSYRTQNEAEWQRALFQSVATSLAMLGVNVDEATRAHYTLRRFIAPESRPEFAPVSFSDPRVRAQFSWDPTLWFPANVTTVRLDMKRMMRYQDALHRFPLKEWKAYLFGVLLYSFTRQARIVAFSSAQTCQEHFGSLFPLSTCRLVRAEIKYPDEFEQWASVAKHTMKEYLVDRNLFEFSPQVVSSISERLDSLQVYVNRCSLKSHNETITKFEHTFLDLDTSSPGIGLVPVDSGGRKGYLDYIFEMAAHPEFQMRRHEQYDPYYRGESDMFFMWNAWYDSRLNSVFIPPGILHFVEGMFHEAPHLYFDALGQPIQHEMTHWLVDPPTFGLLNVLSHTWAEWKKAVLSQYPPSGDSVLNEENLADVLGLYLSWNAWNTPHRTQDQRKAWFIHYLRLQCSQQPDYVSDHGSARQRATIPIGVVWGDFASAFNCSGSLSRTAIELPWRISKLQYYKSGKARQ